MVYCISGRTEFGKCDTRRGGCHTEIDYRQSDVGCGQNESATTVQQRHQQLSIHRYDLIEHLYLKEILIYNLMVLPGLGYVTSHSTGALNTHDQLDFGRSPSPANGLSANSRSHSPTSHRRFHALNLKRIFCLNCFLIRAF